jgi:hypothetical protein
MDGFAKQRHVLILGVLFLFLTALLQSCIVLPKTVPEDNQECLLVTKSMTLDYHTSQEMIDETVDEMVQAIASDCHEPECLLVVAPFVAISVGSLIVSGSIVVTGNTIHWIEKQGRCRESITQQVLEGLKRSAREVGGSVVRTGSQLIDWFQKQNSAEKHPNEKGKP